MTDAARDPPRLKFPTRAGSFAPVPPELHQGLASPLGRPGITRLHTHGRDEWESVRVGHHRVVVIPPPWAGAALPFPGPRSMMPVVLAGWPSGRTAPAPPER